MRINGIDIPEYFGKPYIEIGDNIPDFSEFPQAEKYKELGSYKRCGEDYKIYSAYTCIKESDLSNGISRHSRCNGVSEDYSDTYDFIKGKYLFNYCHLIAYQLLKEESDKRNLIIGTRYMNERGMLPLEMKVRDYLKKNRENHVLYRVTPIFNEGDQLVKGVKMEAFSVEDNGSGICFNKFVYNVQPGVAICYKYGRSAEYNKWYNKIFSQNIYTDEEKGTQNYILNISTHKFHNPNCNCVSPINDENRKEFNWPRQYLIDNGYKPCANCKS